VLATAHEYQGLLDGRIILGNARGQQSLDGKRAVGHIRRLLALLAVVAEASKFGILGIGIVELDALDEIAGFLEKVVVFAVLVGLLEGHDGNAGGVVGQELGVNAAVLLDLFFQVAERLRQEGLLGAVAIL